MQASGGFLRGKYPAPIRNDFAISLDLPSSSNLVLELVNMNWKHAGGIMEYEEVEIGEEIVRREKMGRPKIWEGWCKDGGMVYLGPTERLRCIEGYDEYLREQAKEEGLRRTNSCM